MNDHQALVRPRLLHRLDATPQGGVCLVRGAFASGRTTVLEQWLATSEAEVVWCRTPTLPADGPTRPDVVVVDTDEHEPSATARAARRRWPLARLVVVWGRSDDRLADVGLRADVVLAGASLRLNPTEVREWAEQRGVTLEQAEAVSVVANTHGYPIFVDEIVRAAAERGRFEPDAIVQGCDRALDRLLAQVPGVSTTRAVDTALFAGRAVDLTQAAIDLLQPDPVGAALDLGALVESEMMTFRGRAGAVGFAPGIRQAIDRRFATWVPAARQQALTRSAVAALVENDLLADALALVAPSTQPLVAELVAPHWPLLAAVPARRVRAFCSTLSRPGPHLALAHARARSSTPATTAGPAWSRTSTAAWRDGCSSTPPVSSPRTTSTPGP